MARKQAPIEIGMRFGHLVVIGKSHPVVCGDHNRAASIVKCDCGNTRIAVNTEMLIGKLKCCGLCEFSGNYKHGCSDSKLYKKWKSMNDRCKHPTGKNAKYAGISVCQEWKDFKAFKAWATKHGYRDGLSIDRINPNGNYEPSNCRFITMTEQANNKNNTIYLVRNGERKTLIEWSKITGINPKTIRLRLRRGWSDERALSPINK